jgi:hypothetical protein
MARNWVPAPLWLYRSIPSLDKHPINTVSGSAARRAQNPAKRPACQPVKKHSVKKLSGGIAPTIMEFLRKDSATGGLLPAAERLIQLQQDLNLLLPNGVAAACEAHVSGDGILMIRASSSALAGKLRQMTPSLQTGLVRRGWKVNAIQVRVQPLNSASNSMTYDNSAKPPKVAVMTPRALESWNGLVAELDDSPLQQAVKKLLRHHATGRRED